MRADIAQPGERGRLARDGMRAGARTWHNAIESGEPGFPRAWKTRLPAARKAAILMGKRMNLDVFGRLLPGFSGTRGRARRWPGMLLLLTSAALAEEIPVTVRTVAELAIHPERSAPATVESLNSTELSAEITARVLAIPVRVGAVVEAGARLVELDCRDYHSRLAAEQATLKQLQAQRQFAVHQLERARNLNRQRNISEEEVDRRGSERAALEAQEAAQKEAIGQAERAVERCILHAPYRAAVTARQTQVGALANPGSPLLRLVQLDSLEVSAHVRPDEAREGAEADPLTFLYLGERYPLQIARIAPVVDPATRTVELRLRFTNAAAPAGASGRLLWRRAGASLPPELAVRRNGQLGVFLLADDQARFQVLPEAMEGQPIAIELPPQTRIIVEGRQRLQDGDAVRPSETP